MSHQGRSPCLLLYIIVVKHGGLWKNASAKIQLLRAHPHVNWQSGEVPGNNSSAVGGEDIHLLAEFKRRKMCVLLRSLKADNFMWLWWLIEALAVQIPATTVHMTEVSLGKTLNLPLYVAGSALHGGSNPIVYECVCAWGNGRGTMKGAVYSLKYRIMAV